MTSSAVDYRDLPIVINNFNRRRDLVALVGWLRRAGQRKLIVLDNGSTLPGLDATYRDLEGVGVRVVRLGRNAGARALWTCGLLEQLGIDSLYVYTDSDVVPDEACPSNLVGHLLAALAAAPDIVKVGVGLRIDDLPEHYAKKAEVEIWEAQFWRRPVAPGFFLAPVDTTFAVYRAGSGFALEPALRSGRPYRARHLGWYADSRNPADEDAFYRAAADPAHTNWSGGDLPDLLTAAIDHERRTRPVLINVDCGDDPLPGWINVGSQPGAGVDALFALDGTGPERLPLADDTVDGIFLRCASPGIDDAALRELHRVAKPGAKFIVRHPVEGRREEEFAGCVGWDVVRRDLAGSGSAREIIIELRAVKPPRAAPLPPPPMGILPTPVDPRCVFP